MNATVPRRRRWRQELGLHAGDRPERIDATGSELRDDQLRNDRVVALSESMPPGPNVTNVVVQDHRPPPMSFTVGCHMTTLSSG